MRHSHRYDSRLLEALLEFTPLDSTCFQSYSDSEHLQSLMALLNQSSLGAPRYILKMQFPDEQHSAALLATRYHMGEELTQVLQLSALETGGVTSTSMKRPSCYMA